MDKNIQSLAEKIFNDEEKVKEILNIYDFDVLCDKIKSIEPTINKKDIEELIKNFSKYNKNYLEQINQQDLEEISGGKTSKNYKVMAGLMACLIGLSPSMVSKVSAEEISQKIQEQTIYEKFKDWVSNHKLASGGAGVTLLTALFLATKMKDQPQSQPQPQPQPQESSKRLLERIPDLWGRFWMALDAARDAAYNAAYNTAYYAAGDAAGDAAYNAAGDAAYNAARDATGVGAFNAARDAAYNTAFVNAWRRGGAAYEIVKDKDRRYFENLVRVLEEQIAILEDIVNQDRH